MPRAVRYSPPDSIHHVINRGNDRRCLFASPDDFAEFLGLMARAKGHCPIRVLAYCAMPNHWHLVLWPKQPQAMAAFLHRLCTAHSIRWRQSTGTVGQGHVYQHRYHAFLIESETYYFRALRYVEANPLRAGLVRSAAEWPWSSLAERRGAERGILDPGPLPLPKNWLDQVDACLSPEEIDDFHRRLRKHAPTAPRRKRRSAETAANPS